MSIAISLGLAYLTGLIVIRVFCKHELRDALERLEAERAEALWQSRLLTIITESGGDPSRITAQQKGSATCC
ncbi:MAG: hypothetical protein M0T79_09690 [Actinomycetota bacterium]|nr:hypothetical protein [Actinomycetota bacterium]